MSPSPPPPELEHTWSSLAGALAAALRAAGIGAPLSRVLGVSGLAFRLALPVAGEEIAAASAEPALDPHQFAALAGNLGRRLTVLTSAGSVPGDAAQRAATIRRINRAVAGGIPAIVWNLHLPRFGLVTGVEPDGQAWRVATVLSSQFGGRLPLERWTPPQYPGAVLAFTLGRRAPIEPARAVREALAFALGYAGRGDPGDPTAAIHGTAAYQRWAAAFRHGDAIAPSGNALLVQQLQAARRAAAVFLRGDAARHLPAVAPALARAAAAYDAEVLALSRMATMFPYPAGGDPDTTAARMVAAAALREALACEERAHSAIRAGLAVDD